jgi:DNA repair photolyase
MDFPWYSGDDPSVWLNQVEQFFEYQGTAADQGVILASFHLKWKANRWWQWLQQVHKEEVVTWDVFERELEVWFGSTEYENSDETLSNIKQHGMLRDYQREFEGLANRVIGWP